jgi:hypothetical protein
MLYKDVSGHFHALTALTSGRKQTQLPNVEHSVWVSESVETIWKRENIGCAGNRNPVICCHYTDWNVTAAGCE